MKTATAERRRRGGNDRTDCREEPAPALPRPPPKRGGSPHRNSPPAHPPARPGPRRDRLSASPRPHPQPGDEPARAKRRRAGGLLHPVASPPQRAAVLGLPKADL